MIQVSKVAVEEKAALQNLFQLYSYEMTEFTEKDIEDNGKYKVFPQFDEYWTDKINRFPYFIKVDNRLAGFVLVRVISKQNYGQYHSIAEFFVLKKYRKLGVGTCAANRIFNLHRGDWEVSQIKQNLSAQSFWIKVIASYSTGNFTDRQESNVRIQQFVSKDE